MVFLVIGFVNCSLIFVCVCVGIMFVCVLLVMILMLYSMGFGRLGVEMIFWMCIS